ncbi:signal peptidase I [Streptomyces sp. NPDC046821]|uniref:signal peptidase I n=1 Tax=Streptomyces sp. NPDC046821 TaxID=3154702 RepID=UPI0033F476FF
MGKRGRAPVGDTGGPSGRRRAGADTGSTGARGDEPALPGRAARRKLARKVKRRRQRSALKEIPLLIGVALLIALVLKTFLVQAFVIPSGSMEQTIRIGDRVLVDKFTPWFGAKPHRGDVVVFKDPGGWLEQEQAPKKESPVVIKQVKEGLTWIGLLPSDDEKDLIKRVIAVGGDTVKCCDKQGHVMVNGKPLDEPYINPGDVPSESKFDIKVPEGRLFVLGDHRSNSADSRFHTSMGFGGTVPEETVVGRARVIAWPIGHWRTLGEPDTFASVPDPRSGAAAARAPSHRLASADLNGLIPFPSPAELPLVMGVVGLHRVWDRRRHGVRSGCGGLGGRSTVGARARRAARTIRRRSGAGRDGRREPRE